MHVIKFCNQPHIKVILLRSPLKITLRKYYRLKCFEFLKLPRFEFVLYEVVLIFQIYFYRYAIAEWMFLNSSIMSIVISYGLIDGMIWIISKSDIVFILLFF